MIAVVSPSKLVFLLLSDDCHGFSKQAGVKEMAKHRIASEISDYHLAQ